jgi:hypothetical protein
LSADEYGGKTTTIFLTSFSRKENPLAGIEIKLEAKLLR